MIAYPHKIFKSMRTGLSGRLLLLTILFVMLAEILIYVPSIALFRKDWLEDRLASAQIAALALEASSGRVVSERLSRELLANAQVEAVVLKRGDTRKLILGEDVPLEIVASYDLRDAPVIDLIVDAFLTFRLDNHRLIQITGIAKQGAGEYVQVMLYPDDLKQAMIDYSRNIFVASLVISLFTALLVYITLHALLVRPIKRITHSVIAFRKAPEVAASRLEPSLRYDEIGQVEQELADMQRDLRSALTQKTRLANLGTAVSKINHDLRNILASAQLLSDRLANTEDPNVAALAPRVMRALDRAIALCSATLTYGRSEELEPQLEHVNLHQLVNDVGVSLGLIDQSTITWHNQVPIHAKIMVDADQFYRVLLNLGRNAVQALGNDVGTITVTVDKSEDATIPATIPTTIIDISDTGPGLSTKAQEHLFEPFRGSSTSGGTGLGLAISKELVEAHGGTLALLKTGSAGSVFRITLPTH